MRCDCQSFGSFCHIRQGIDKTKQKPLKAFDPLLSLQLEPLRCPGGVPESYLVNRKDTPYSISEDPAGGTEPLFGGE